MRTLLAALLFCILGSAFAEDESARIVPANIIPQPGQVLASGVVPDEKTKVDIINKLEELYGKGNIIDQIDVGGVVAPPNWDRHVGNLISAPLKEVHRGQLEIDGTQIRIRGEVANEVLRQEIVSTLATSLNRTYRISNALRVAADEQPLLDDILANRIVEFEVSSARLTVEGKKLLDEVADLLPQLLSEKIQIIGHTDSTGSRATNLALSQARADAVKNYLTEKGLPEARFETLGVGPDQPVASNSTPDGRAKNRRIEFRAGN